MNREEALRELRGAFNQSIYNDELTTKPLDLHVVAAAIAALEVQPSYDAIDRKKVIEIIRNIDVREDVCDAIIKVMNMPSVFAATKEGG